jgi:hypothetical protein
MFDIQASKDPRKIARDNQEKWVLNYLATT